MISVERHHFTDPILAGLATDIYNGKIDGMQTNDIASRYGISKAKALKALKIIASGMIFEGRNYPFGEYNELMGGVEIHDGTTFTYGDNAEYMEGRKGNNHYNWFTH